LNNFDFELTGFFFVFIAFVTFFIIIITFFKCSSIQSFQTSFVIILQDKNSIIHSIANNFNKLLRNLHRHHHHRLLRLHLLQKSKSAIIIFSFNSFYHRSQHLLLLHHRPHLHLRCLFRLMMKNIHIKQIHSSSSLTTIFIDIIQKFQLW